MRAIELGDVRRVVTDFVPKVRLERDEDRLAAVAAIFRDSDQGAELLFIHRAEDSRDPWSGHMAFPGGRVEPEDIDPLAASIRETREELGLDLGEHATKIGGLSDVTAVARGRRLGLTIVPFVFEIEGDPPIRPNHEVQEALWIPLSFFSAESGNKSTMQWQFGDVAIPLPCYRFEGRLIWGLTCGMIDELTGLLEG